VSAYLELLVRLVSGTTPKARRKKALAALFTLVRAVSMARAVNDDTLSREILTSVADELKSELG
jgi:TetR/AcrR family transcriptional regulator, transcriptional repressor for nem operon